MIKISITGDLGSGKSAVCNIIQHNYKFDIYHTGKIQRQIAQRYNMSTLELNQYSETHPEIDKEIDDALVAIGKLNSNIVLDSRLAWHFVPSSFKVFLKVDIDMAVKRIMNDAKRGRVETYFSFEDAKKKLLSRKLSENSRYLEKYKVDCSDYGNFDLIIDTSLSSPQSIAKTIIDMATLWSKEEPFAKYWVSLKSIYPLTNKCWQHDKHTPCINVIEVNGLYYTVKNELIPYFQSVTDLVPINIIARDNEPLDSNSCTAKAYIKHNFDMDVVYEWENRFNFKFFKRPWQEL